MYISSDRVFWIYFIVCLFIIIIGLIFIVRYDNSYYPALAVFWTLAMICLTLLVYYAASEWSPYSDGQICVIDNKSDCFDSRNRMWLFVNLLFVIVLIFSILWAAELNNIDNSPLCAISGIIVLMIGLLLVKLAVGRNDTYNVNGFWIGVLYLILWLGLTIYVVIS